VRFVTFALIAVSGCASPEFVEGPPSPGISAIDAIVVSAVDDPGRTAAVRSDEIADVAESWAFSRGGWTLARGRELVPLYRIEFRIRGGSPAVYWLGTNSYPPTPPCSSLCSGWWVAPSRAKGVLDDTRYKGLVSADYLPLIDALPLEDLRESAAARPEETD
jgi:hypothetical protein